MVYLFLLMEFIVRHKYKKVFLENFCSKKLCKKNGTDDFDYGIGPTDCAMFMYGT